MSHSKNNSARYGHKCEDIVILSTRCSCRIKKKLEFYRQIFEKSSNIKFYRNPSSGSRVVPCGRTAMTQLIVAIRDFANAPKNVICCLVREQNKSVKGSQHKN
jgi:hypothetical protein